jgi:hypothetical protein
MPTDPIFSTPDPAALLGEPQPIVAESSAPAKSGDGKAERVLARESARLFGLPGVVMVGLGRDEIGDDAIVVGVKEAGHVAQMPREIDGVRVMTTVIGEVDALPAKAKRRK